MSINSVKARHMGAKVKNGKGVSVIWPASDTVPPVVTFGVSMD